MKDNTMVLVALIIGMSIVLAAGIIADYGVVGELISAIATGLKWGCTATIIIVMVVFGIIVLTKVVD